MTFLCFVWLESKNKAQRNTVDSLVKLTCQHDLFRKFEAGLAADQKERTTVLARPGLQPKESAKIISHALRGAIQEISSKSPEFRTHAAEFALASDKTRAQIVSLAIDRAEIACPEQIKDAEAAKAKMAEFLVTHFKVFPH